jgi:hypothetical protein
MHMISNPAFGGNWQHGLPFPDKRSSGSPGQSCNRLRPLERGTPKVSWFGQDILGFSSPTQPRPGFDPP